MRLQVLELDHVSEINQEVAAEVCREGLKGLEMLVLTSTPVTPKALLHFNSEYEDWLCQLRLKPPIGPCQLKYCAPPLSVMYDIWISNAVSILVLGVCVCV